MMKKGKEVSLRSQRGAQRIRASRQVEKGQTLGVRVAEGGFTHVGELDGALGRRVHEEVTVYWVEFGGGDDFGKLLHICRLDVDDVYKAKRARRKG
jgi:hypothetical protein